VGFTPCHLPPNCLQSTLHVRWPCHAHVCGWRHVKFTLRAIAGSYVQLPTAIKEPLQPGPLPDDQKERLLARMNHLTYAHLVKVTPARLHMAAHRHGHAPLDQLPNKWLAAALWPQLCNWVGNALRSPRSRQLLSCVVHVCPVNVRAAASAPHIGQTCRCCAAAWSNVPGQLCPKYARTPLL
jgi:hypothetical protein